MTQTKLVHLLTQFQKNLQTTHQHLHTLLDAGVRVSLRPKMMSHYRSHKMSEMTKAICEVEGSGHHQMSQRSSIADFDEMQNELYKSLNALARHLSKSKTCARLKRWPTITVEVQSRSIIINIDTTHGYVSLLRQSPHSFDVLSLRKWHAFCHICLCIDHAQAGIGEEWIVTPFSQSSRSQEIVCLQAVDEDNALAAAIGFYNPTLALHLDTLLVAKKIDVTPKTLNVAHILTSQPNF